MSFRSGKFYRALSLAVVVGYLASCQPFPLAPTGTSGAEGANNISSSQQTRQLSQLAGQPNQGQQKPKRVLARGPYGPPLKLKFEFVNGKLNVLDNPYSVLQSAECPPPLPSPYHWVTDHTCSCDGGHCQYTYNQTFYYVLEDKGGGTTSYETWMHAEYTNTCGDPPYSGDTVINSGYCFAPLPSPTPSPSPSVQPSNSPEPPPTPTPAPTDTPTAPPTTPPPPPTPTPPPPDPKPLSIEADRFFSPNGDGRMDSNLVKIECEGDWKVTANGTVIRTGSGNETFSWLGYPLSGGDVLPDANYKLTLTKVSNGDSVEVPVIVDTAPPKVDSIQYRAESSSLAVASASIDDGPEGSTSGFSPDSIVVKLQGREVNFGTKAYNSESKKFTVNLPAAELFAFFTDTGVTDKLPLEIRVEDNAGNENAYTLDDKMEVKDFKVSYNFDKGYGLAESRGTPNNPIVRPLLAHGIKHTAFDIVNYQSILISADQLLWKDGRHIPVYSEPFVVPRGRPVTLTTEWDCKEGKLFSRFKPTPDGQYVSRWRNMFGNVYSEHSYRVNNKIAVKNPGPVDIHDILFGKISATFIDPKTGKEKRKLVSKGWLLIFDPEDYSEYWSRSIEINEAPLLYQSRLKPHFDRVMKDPNYSAVESERAVNVWEARVTYDVEIDDHNVRLFTDRRYDFNKDIIYETVVDAFVTD